jgi:hypothetical protein
VAAARSLKQLRREYDSIHATDYFPGPAAAQAGELLAEVEMALIAPGEPQAQAGRIPRLNCKDYVVQLATARSWIDHWRAAIKRFIDRGRIVWLGTQDLSAPCWFRFRQRRLYPCWRARPEVLLVSFALEGVRPERLAGVHYLDVGVVPVEAAGLETILNGARRQHVDDDRLLGEAAKTFDYLYNAFSQE